MQIKKQNWHIEDLRCFSDERGELTLCTFEKEFEFSPKRLFYITNVAEGAVRGKHAHLHHRQCLICLKGDCLISLDNGPLKENILLSSESRRVLLIENLIWIEMSQFSPGCILLVLSSGDYKEEDVIKDYAQFSMMTME